MPAFDPLPGEIRGPIRVDKATVESCRWKAELFTGRAWVAYHGPDPQAAIQSAKDAWSSKSR